MLKGAMLVGVADSRGTIYNPQGLSVDALIELKKAGKNVADYPDGKKLDRDAVIDIA
jgi:glutamate dehydrogenase (NAD(P)+)